MFNNILVLLFLLKSYNYGFSRGGSLIKRDAYKLKLFIMQRHGHIIEVNLQLLLFFLFFAQLIIAKLYAKSCYSKLRRDVLRHVRYFANCLQNGILSQNALASQEVLP